MKRINVDSALKIIRDGGVVAIPTETVYGLAADATNPRAVARIFEIKNRPTFNPLICHLPDSNSVFRFGKGGPLSEKLGHLWPGPLTLLLPHNGSIPLIVTAGSHLCGFRVPRHELTLSLLRKFERPVCAPSANKSGNVSPTSADMVHRQLGSEIDGILDGGPCEIGLESTVVHCDETSIHIMREGALSREQLSKIAPVKDGTLQISNQEANTGMIHSPGQLLKHYSPGVPLVLIDSNFRGGSRLDIDPTTVGVIDFGKHEIDLDAFMRINISAKGDPIEGAHRLFGALENLGSQPLTYIVAALLPENGIGRAINDRLRRGACIYGTIVDGVIYAAPETEMAGAKLNV